LHDDVSQMPIAYSYLCGSLSEPAYLFKAIWGFSRF
jgi:hypothetical protein